MVFVVAFALALSLGVIWAGLVTWPAMLLFGAVHSFLPIVPAFGFWQTFAVILLLRFIIPTSSTRAAS